MFISQIQIKLWYLNNEDENGSEHNMFQGPKKRRGATIGGGASIRGDAVICAMLVSLVKLLFEITYVTKRTRSKPQ